MCYHTSRWHATDRPILPLRQPQDDLQDLGGNYAADVADMAGNVELAAWLRAECSDARARSCAALGLPPNTTDLAVIRAAYLECARRLHPDRQVSAAGEEGAAAVSSEDVATGEGGALRGSAPDFEGVRAAYAHLMEGGGGNQSNPTHSLHKMLRAVAPSGGGAATAYATGVGIAAGNSCADTAAAAAAREASEGSATSEENAALFFKARLAATVHEYGDKGLPIGSLRRKFAQVWRGHEVPPPTAFGLPARTPLLKLLEHFDDTVTVVKFPDGRPARLVAVVSRADALGQLAPTDEAAQVGAGGTAQGGGNGTPPPAHEATSATTLVASLPPISIPSHVTAPQCPRPVVIIGGGLGGLAAAIALQSHGVPVVVYERDAGWDKRRRGYGLTLGPTCWAALAALGLEDEVREVDDDCTSTCHWVFDAKGEVLGYFGTAFSGRAGAGRNLRVPRLTLRRMLYEQLTPGTVRWGWRLTRYEEMADRRGVTVHLARSAEATEAAGAVAPAGSNEASSEGTEVVDGSVLIGADGVRSVVRAQKYGDPLRYVGVVIVLGVSTHAHPLLSNQGFYTVDGTHRLFTMPYERIDGSQPERHTTMWQVSLAMPDEAEARALCAAGGGALLEEIQRRCGAWHAPVPQMLEETVDGSVWGDLLLDRAPMPLRRKNHDEGAAPWRSRVAVLGDAAHAMTPFKGQGANQALADAPLLAKHMADALLHEAANPGAGTTRVAAGLSCFEREMCKRAEAKVAASREAAGIYHSMAALEPTAYSVNGVPETLQPALLEALRGGGITAEAAGELEASAVATWRQLEQRQHDAPEEAPGAAA